MTKETPLSEKIVERDNPQKPTWVWTKDVREAVKKLKDAVHNAQSIGDFDELLIEIFGSELSK